MFQSTIAAGLLFALGTTASSVISKGEGVGTYYYDTKQVDACGTSFKFQNMGGVMCSSQTLLSLDKMDTEYVVAMSNADLGADPSKYCGKKVVVTVDGKKSDMPLFIGDGCERCNGEPGLDFSYSVLNKLTGGDACNNGKTQISWEILDDTIYNFDGDSSGFASGSGGSSGPSSPQPPTPTTLVTSAASSSTSSSSTSCQNNAWQCNGNVIEQCINSSWTPRTTCAAGASCSGGSNPYCH
ncbi:hypothetical protein PHISCL_03727 [Aspergillus sclerotialis]|uniref:Chitinase n=1 Tax=Aspergillus sclerotialis TaxID=2070753 RepID=A0A3A3A3H8_9EURO|nr:hypothetical protein PHISCL_03727 [Aspergillus sclerotialis]